ncbi:MAG: hypothetical protein P8Q92_15370 [Pseudoprimorskyibacter sp.]|nr:hypothetical protein [Pseudoprimorskyibacter sp.]
MIRSRASAKASRLWAAGISPPSSTTIIEASGGAVLSAEVTARRSPSGRSRVGMITAQEVMLGSYRVRHQKKEAFPHVQQIFPAESRFMSGSDAGECRILR